MTTDLALKITDTANALDIDAAWWRNEAERDDLDPADSARYLGRAEAMEWAALAIRGEALRTEGEDGVSMEIDIRIGSARVVLDPQMMTGSRGLVEVSPSSTVADLTKVVVAACRALGTDEALDLARYMTGKSA